MPLIGRVASGGLLITADAVVDPSLRLEAGIFVE
jgi:hypothetical protein